MAETIVLILNSLFGLINVVFIIMNSLKIEKLKDQIQNIKLERLKAQLKVATSQTTDISTKEAELQLLIQQEEEAMETVTNKQLEKLLFRQ